ncbi:MAG: hypothetical protein JXR48_08960 [Candidatus Delongbacteria bacterium]|nr:hypothetical protein [Candidatus Delongbacteria bacterium]MBN2835080.1 hypothetical protein [Candidatus Delongbacteria bacterium]
MLFMVSSFLIVSLIFTVMITYQHFSFKKNKNNRLDQYDPFIPNSFNFDSKEDENKDN